MIISIRIVHYRIQEFCYIHAVIHFYIDHFDYHFPFSKTLVFYIEKRYEQMYGSRMFNSIFAFSHLFQWFDFLYVVMLMFTGAICMYLLFLLIPFKYARHILFQNFIRLQILSVKIPKYAFMHAHFHFNHRLTCDIHTQVTM